MWEGHPRTGQKAIRAQARPSQNVHTLEVLFASKLATRARASSVGARSLVGISPITATMRGLILVGAASIGLAALALLQRRRRRLARDILLIPYPGGTGRVAMLQRLIREMPHREFAVLVPQELSHRYGWTREEVGSDNFLCYDGAPSGEPIERALDVVMQWSKVGRIAGILCYDEYGLELSARLCRSLGLVGTSPELLRVLRDKHAFRRACAVAGMRTVQHMPCNLEAVEAIASGAREWPFPSILKPRSGAGSECTLKVDSAADLRAAWASACAKMGVAQPGAAPNGAGLVGTVEWSTFDERIKRMGFVLEEFFEGIEIDVDGWASCGRVDFALVAENRGAHAPHYPTATHAMCCRARTPQRQGFTVCLAHACCLLCAPDGSPYRAHDGRSRRLLPDPWTPRGTRR